MKKIVLFIVISLFFVILPQMVRTYAYEEACNVEDCPCETPGQAGCIARAEGRTHCSSWEPANPALCTNMEPICDSCTAPCSSTTPTPPVGPNCPVGADCTGGNFCCTDSNGNPAVCQTCNTGNSNADNSGCEQGPVIQESCSSGETCDNNTNSCISTSQPPGGQLSCGQACDTSNNQCPQQCPYCNDNGSGQTVCQGSNNQPPSYCGGSCQDNSQCPGGCSQCVPNGQGQNVCQPGPGETPGETPGSTPGETPGETPGATPGETPGATPGETPGATPGETPGATPGETPGATPGGPTVTQAPTPTPTPAFNQAMCQCDGIQLAKDQNGNQTALFAGQAFQVDSFAKVTGTDTSLAQVKDQKFYITQDNTIISANGAQGVPVPAQVISNSASEVRYQSSWKSVFPAQVNTNSVYRIFSKIDCEKKSSAAQDITLIQPTATPTPVSTPKPSIWSRIVSFFVNLFGGNKKSSPPQSVAPRNYTPVTPSPALVKDQSLQLQNFNPAQVTYGTDANNCRFIIVKFPNQSSVPNQ